MSGYFNPRPPRGGRHAQHRVSVRGSDFNPRPPEGGRRGGWTQNYGYIVISIHAPAMNSDWATHCISIHAPARGATVVHRTGYAIDGISIHAPREGGDVGTINGLPLLIVFQSTPPAKGATSEGSICNRQYVVFQSTPPATGATRPSTCQDTSGRFQSTPPAKGATRL